MIQFFVPGAGAGRGWVDEFCLHRCRHTRLVFQGHSRNRIPEVKDGSSAARDRPWPSNSFSCFLQRFAPGTPGFDCARSFPSACAFPLGALSRRKASSRSCGGGGRQQYPTSERQNDSDQSITAYIERRVGRRLGRVFLLNAPPWPAAKSPPAVGLWSAPFHDLAYTDVFSRATLLLEGNFGVHASRACGCFYGPTMKLCPRGPTWSVPRILPDRIETDEGPRLRAEPLVFYVGEQGRLFRRPS